MIVDKEDIPFLTLCAIIFVSVFYIYLCIDIANQNKLKIKPPITLFVSNYDDETTISKNLGLKLKKFNRNWSKENKKIATTALKVGQDEFNIDHKIILSIMALESEMKIVITNKNTNGTIDYGLTMQNSIAKKQRYKAAEEILKRHNIKYSNSKFDISKNILSAYIYYNDIRQEYEYDFKRSIMAYNVGIRGAKLEHKQKKGEKYFVAFAKHYNDFAY